LAVYAAIVLTLLVVSGASHRLASLKLTDAGSVSRTWFVPSVTSLRLISLGFDQLLADVMWLQFIQYVGDNVACKADDGSRASAMLDVVTTLDPHFEKAYFFIATVVGGEEHDPQGADKLLQRGIDNNANNWYIPFIAGINQYLFAHNETQAAKYYRMSAKFPDAPPWLAGQATILEAHIPSNIKAINVWQKILDSAKDSAVRQRAREELCVLWVHVRDHAPPDSVVRNRAEQELTKLGVNLFRSH
jgi:hypothetical protein